MGPRQQRLEGRVDESRSFGDPDAQERDENHAERMEVGERVHHVAQKLGERLRGELIVDHLLLWPVLRLHLERMAAEQRRHDPRRDRPENEENRRVGELVADPLDAIERSIDPSLLGRRFRRIHA